MKVMKKMMALVIAAVMMVAMVVPVAAATLTINNAGNIKTDHTYEAYQIFSGTLSTDGKTLSDIVWGAGVDGSALLTALQADTTIGTKFTTATSANDVALALKNATADEMVDFSRVVANHLATKAAEGVGKIENLADGYYFVKDVTAIAAGAEDALSAYIVDLIGNKEITIKTDAPHIEKKLKNHEELAAAYRDANNVGIGDVVDYQITSKVPNMANYKKYYFIVHDTLSKGLTYDANSLAITVGTKTLEKNTDYTVTATNADDKTTDTTIEIVFKNFIQYQTSQPGADITINYSATLNDAAAIGVNGNPNEVYLEYSNNPNKEGKGEDKPNEGEDDVTGTTPVDTVITYSTNLKIKKVDENGSALDGVTFTIYGYGENEKTTYTEEFEETEGGEYWKLNTTPATYTKTAPTTLTAGKYADQNKKYNLVVKKNSDVETIEYAAKQATTANGGIIDIGALFNGSLPAGTYVIHEDSTVSGYNVLDHDIIVKVTAKVGDVADINAVDPTKATTVTWGVDGKGATVKDGLIEVEIENKSGAVLPSTGGMGTTIFYVIGGLLIVAAAIVIISKRRVQEG